MEAEIQYFATFDSNIKSLEGGNHYKLNLLSIILASNFWPAIAYNEKALLILQTDQPWQSMFRNNKSL